MGTFKRGTGRTSEQMKAAPHGAFFVVHADHFRGYAQNLAKHLGRDDLIIVGPDLTRLRGTQKAIVIDHFALAEGVGRDD